MSRAEEKPVCAGTERNCLNGVRIEKSLDNEQIENILRLFNESIGRLDALEKKRAQAAIETRTKLSLLITALDKKTAHLEQLSQSYRASRKTRDNETQTIRTEMVRWFREEIEEDLTTPDNRGVGSEGLILPNELPGLPSAGGDLPARRELTNGIGAMADRPEEASNKRSMGGLECHDIQTVKTPEVQPKSEPTCQLKLQEVRQFDKKIVPLGQPLPQRVYEPPSRRCWEQLPGKSSRSHKRPCEGQPDRFGKRQATVTGKGFHHDKFPIMRAPEQNRTPAQISGGSQSISQSPMYGPLYGNTGHFPEGPASEVQSGSSFCSACLSAQSSQVCCSTTHDRSRINSINPAAAPARWSQQDYNVHPTYPTPQNPSTRYGSTYGSRCGPPSYINSIQYQVASNMPSMCPQRSNNSMYFMYNDRRFPGYPATAPAQILPSASNIPPGHSQTPNFLMVDPRTHFRLNPDSYGTEDRDMRSEETTAANRLQPTPDTNRASFRNTTTSGTSSIMHSVAPIGRFETLERQGREAEAMGGRLRNVAIKAMQVADANGGRVEEES